MTGTGGARTIRTECPAASDEWPDRGARRSPYRRGVISSTVIDSSPVALAGRLAALSDPVRLRILEVLAGGGRCVCDLHQEVPVAANLLSYHLRVLRQAGLVIAARRGRWVDYRLDGDGFGAMWTQAHAAGLPLPGDRVITDRYGSPCQTTAKSVCDD